MSLNLNEKQLEFLAKKRDNRFGGFGSFLGMCINISVDTAKPFEEVLKTAIDNVMAVEEAIDEYLKKKEDEIPEF